jgi:hypothetical protein
MQDSVAGNPVFNQGSKRGLEESDLDYNMITVGRKLQGGDSLWTSAVSRLLISEILLYFPEFWLNGHKLYPKDKFIQLLKDYWIPFCREALLWIWIVGIVPFRLRVLKSGEIVPSVIEGEAGKHFKLTTWYDAREDTQKFSYYRIISKKTGKYKPASIDKKVLILSNFGYNPNYDGTLKSIVACIIAKEFFLNRMTLYTLRSENTRSKPMILTETSKDSLGAFDPSSAIAYFGEMDPNVRQEERSFVKNDAEIEASIRHNSKFFELQMKAVQPSNRTDPNYIDYTEPQIKNNFMPLPTNHKLVNQQLPESRTDWTAMNRVYQEDIFAAFTLPRQALVTDGSGRSLGNADMANNRFNKTINSWRTTLSDILTKIYCSIYGDRDCMMDLEKIDIFSLEKMKDEHVVGMLKDVNVLVTIPNAISLGLSDLLNQYDLGIITWEHFVSFVWRSSGYNMMDLENSTMKTDPWDMEAKISMLQKSKVASEAKKTGDAFNVMLGQPMDGDKKTDKDDKKKKKKKKKQISDDEEEEEEESERPQKKKKKSKN